MIHKSPLFIFIHIPKTGGSSIERAFGKTKWGPKPFKDPLRKRWIWREKDAHLPARVLKNSFPLTYRRAFTFCFVRNSWDYVVSSYHWLYQHKNLRTPFTDWVLQDFPGTRRREMNIFMKPCQLDWITDARGNIIVDFIGRFENLHSDFDHVCKHLDVNPGPLPVFNTAGKRKPYPEYYNDETRNLIAQRYHRDIDHFKFRFGDATDHPCPIFQFQQQNPKTDQAHSPPDADNGHENTNRCQ